MFQISLELLWVPLHLIFYYGLVVNCLISLIFLWILSWRSVEFCQWLFWHMMRWSRVFLFFIQIFLYWITYWFSDVELTLHLWDKAYLIMVDDIIDMTLDPIFEHFLSMFIGKLVCNSYLCWIFVWFGYDCGLLEQIWHCSFCLYFVK